MKLNWVQYNQVVLLILSSISHLQCNANNHHLPEGQQIVGQIHEGRQASSNSHSTHNNPVKRQINHYEEELLLHPHHLHRNVDSDANDRIDQQVAHYEPLTLADNQQESRQQQQQAKSKRTLYACEEKQLQIECQLGESIQLIRANYGRFSIQICNEHGQLDWKVNCMSASSYEIIANSCQAKQSCQLLASNSIFGDSCPGTQKYLEVHYQCVSAQLAANNSSSARNPSGGYTSPGSKGSNKQPIVIQPQQQREVATATIPSASSETSSSGTRPSPSLATSWPAPPPRAQLDIVGHPISGYPTRPQLPPWMPALQSPASGFEATGAPAAPVPGVINAPAAVTQQEPANGTRPGALLHCPETVWRQIRWPATEAGHSVQMPCPPHAHSGNPNDPYPASLSCTARGVWAPRVQAGRCQSIWLRNLTQRLEAGDSPLSVMAELVHKTSPGLAQHQATPLLTVITQSGWPGATSAASGAGYIQPSALFGDDIAQIGRIVRRLVDDMSDLMNRISDDKQRHGFAKEMVQSLVELTSNLAHEHQTDAWMDRAAIPGERQRIAGQLVQSLESAAVLMAGAQANSQRHQQQSEDEQVAGEQVGGKISSSSTSFLRVSENVYVAIKSLALQQQPAQVETNQTLEVSFPSKSSTLGTKWMDLEQRFTLHLQTAPAEQQQQSPRADVKYSAPSDAAQPGPEAQTLGTSAQTLRIVFVMIKGLGAQMEPETQTAAAAATTTTGDQINQNTMIVNSNLVSLAIVADSRFKYNPLKVDLSAPVELVFRHLDAPAPGSGNYQGWFAGGPSEQAAPDSSSRQRSSRCVYWDTGASDWLSDGCKLIESNATHSVCACNHLTSFALLTERGDADLSGSGANSYGDSPLGTSQRQHHQQQQPALPRVQLESIEDQLELPNRALSLAKMLDGLMFGPDPRRMPGTAANSRLLIYISCLLSATLLAVHLLAAAYSQAHARRLLGAIPAQPPPPILVTSNSAHSQVHLATGHAAAVLGALRNPGSSMDNTSPTYTSSDYSTALANTKSKLQSGPFDTMARQWNVVGANQLHLNAPQATHCFIARRLQVTIRTVVQLLSLEILIVLLVESQNHLERSQTKTTATATANYYQHWMLNAEPADSFQPIGVITWMLVMSLYYLIASITCWLASQLLSLNLKLLRQCNVNETSSLCGSDSADSAADNKGQYAPPTTATTTSTSAASSGVNPVGGLIYGGGGAGARPATMIYGAADAYLAGQGQPHQHPSTSPTSSFSSGGQSAVTDQQAALAGRIDESARLYAGAPMLSNGHMMLMKNARKLPHHRRPSYLHRLLLGQRTEGGKLAWTLEHLLPVLATGLIAYLSMGPSQFVNSLYYTTGFGLQLACWPLLVEASASGLVILLYYGPSVCFALALIALFALRRSQRRQRQPLAWTNAGKMANGPQFAEGNVATSIVNPYGSSSMVVNGLTSAEPTPATTNQAALNKQHQYENPQQVISTTGTPMQSNGAIAGWQMGDTKRAKFLCSLLLALVALHSISWISFFAHLHRMLAGGAGVASKQANYHLIYVFSVSNLLLVLLLIWSQRSTLRRASQLAGLSRLLSSGCCSCFSFLSGAIHSTDSSPSIYHKRSRLQRHQSGAQQQQQHHHHHHQTLHQRSNSCGNSGGVKISPSSQSLFLISQQQQQQQRRQFAGGNNQDTNYHYGPTYSSGSQQQHLYQQLNGGPQMHIYDSTSGLNEQRQLNMMHLAHQQQHQFHQQPQHPFTLNRSMTSLVQQQQQQHQRQLMTLKPMPSNGNSNHQHLDNGQLLILDAHQALKQQMASAVCRQNSGEADGPLVAFSSNSSSSNQHLTATSNPPSTTFGPTNHQAVTSSQQQRQQQSTEHRQFNNQPRQHPDQGKQDANQRQLYSIDSNSNSGNNSNPGNYNDALKAAIIQQTEHPLVGVSNSASLHQFRQQQQQQQQRFQQQLMIDRGECANNNIYDVANYMS